MGRPFLGGYDDGVIRVWDVESGVNTRNFTGHVRAVLGMVVSQDGTRLFSASVDWDVKYWDIGTASNVRSYSHNMQATSVIVNQDGTQLFTSSADGSARQWQI